MNSCILVWLSAIARRTFVLEILLTQTHNAPHARATYNTIALC